MNASHVVALAMGSLRIPSALTAPGSVRAASLRHPLSHQAPPTEVPRDVRHRVARGILFPGECAGSHVRLEELERCPNSDFRFFHLPCRNSCMDRYNCSSL